MASIADRFVLTVDVVARTAYRRLGRPALRELLAGPLSGRLVARSDLQSGDTANVIECFSYDDVETFDCPAPIGIQPLPETFESEIGHRSIPRPLVATLENVDLVGPWGLTILPGNRYVVEQSEGSVRRLSDTLIKTVVNGEIAAYAGNFRAETRLRGPVVSFVGRFDTDFFHWFFDYLPRVFGIEAYEHRTGEEPSVLLPADPPTWLTDSLEWVGVDPERWITYPGGRVYVDRLVVPSMRRPAYDDDIHGWSVVSPACVATLRDRIRAEVGVTPSSVERIYVSRADADERRVTNEAAVLETLADHGFERHVLSEYDLAEQVALFADAELVVAPHGAGLTNTMYAEHATVVELFGETVNPCYYSLATGLGLEYAYLRCEPVDGDLRVDVDALQDTLDAATGGSGTLSGR